MREIRTGKIKGGTIAVPGSKSYSHRMAIAAGLADGKSVIYNLLDSEDTRYTLSALEQLGVFIEKSGGQVVIRGRAGRFAAADKPVYLGNSGTSMRLLTALAALGEGRYVFSGTERMHERPIGELLDALQQLGIHAVSANQNDCPPVEIVGGAIEGDTVSIDCSVSSQYLSALLLMAPCTENGMTIHVDHGPVSKPYVDMTVDIMEQFGIRLDRNGYTDFRIPGGQLYRSGSYTVEPDCSQAGYFWAAGAVTGAPVTVSGVSKDCRQGDVRLAEILNAMGCRVFYCDDGIAVTGPDRLSAIDADMGDMPDLVPTLAVVAAFAEGETVIGNVAHLAEKESDRLSAVVNELKKMGVDAAKTEDGIRIRGGKPHGATIATYDDHRIAMSFAVAGLVVPDIIIENERCVEKSFPDFWDVFERLYAP